MKSGFSLSQFQQGLTRSLLITLTLTCVLIVFAHQAYHYRLRQIETSYQREKLTSAITAVTHRINESLLVVSNTMQVRDFLRSGPVSREKLSLELSVLGSNLKFPEVAGIALLDESKTIIYQQGEISGSSMDLKLCYMNDFVDPEFGVCRAYWRIYFDIDTLVTSVRRFESRISGCPSCKPIDIQRANLFPKFPIDDPAQIHIRIKFENNYSDPTLWFEGILFVFLVVFGVAIVYRTKLQIEKGLIKPLRILTNEVNDSLAKNEMPLTTPIEILSLVTAIRTWREKFLQSQKLEAEAEYFHLARQVAHDIRSPLWALKTAVANMDQSPSVAKDLIESTTERINEIAEDLLDKQKLGAIKQKAVETDSLVQLCTEVISEKSAEYTNVKDISFKLIASENVQAAVSIKHRDLKRILSNLLNNCAEADATECQISILTKDKDQCQILVLDNGKGIPVNVVKDVGNEGFSFGKDGGNGLGVHHAKQTILKYGGSFNLTSQVGKGTQVEIVLPLLTPATTV